MEDARLLKISFAVSSLGLVLLFFASDQLQPCSMNVSDITLSDTGAKVVTVGRLSSLKYHEDGHVFFDITDGSEKVQVVIFQDTADEMDVNCLKEGTDVEVEGRVEEYRGVPEIIVDDVEGMRCLN